MQDQYQDI
jgi:hypothetical protein